MPDGSTPNTIKAENADSASRSARSAKPRTPKQEQAPAGAFDISGKTIIGADMAEVASAAGALAMRAAAENLEAGFSFGQARLERCLATARELAGAGSPTTAFEIEARYAKDAVMAYADFFTDALSRMSRAMSDAAAPKSAD